MKDEAGEKRPTGPGRWSKGGLRYTGDQRKALAKYEEQPGFRNGAKVRVPRKGG